MLSLLPHIAVLFAPLKIPAAVSPMGSAFGNAIPFRHTRQPIYPIHNHTLTHAPSSVFCREKLSPIPFAFSLGHHCSHRFLLSVPGPGPGQTVSNKSYNFLQLPMVVGRLFTFLAGNALSYGVVSFIRHI